MRGSAARSAVVRAGRAGSGGEGGLREESEGLAPHRGGADWWVGAQVEGRMRTQRPRCCRGSSTW